MAVKEIDIDLAQIQTDIETAITVNAPGNIPVDYIDACFQAKNKGNCDVIFVQDFTDYAVLTGINVANSIIYASLWLVHDSAQKLVVAEAPYAPSDSWQYEGLAEGCYEVRIRLDYDVTVSAVNYPNTIKELTLKITLDCCANPLEDLKSNLVTKISQLACKIKDYGYIGRDFNTLLNNQYILQGILWAISSCYINCEDFQLFKCMADKVITNCNC